MNAGAMIESTQRRPKDYFHFALTTLGVVMAIAGVIIVSWRTVICGAVLIVLGLAYFGVED
jgi:hypothetical protein